MTDVDVRVPVVDAAPIGHEVDTPVAVGLTVPHTIDLAITLPVHRAVDNVDRHWLDGSNVDRTIDDIDRHSISGLPDIGRRLPGQPRQSTEDHHQRCERHRSRSPHVHPFRCVPYRRDSTARFDAVGGRIRRLASTSMRRAIETLGVAVIGFGIYGVAVDSPFVSYYIPITVVLAVVVGWIHRSARFADSTLMALTLAAIGNLAGGVLLIGEGTLYGAVVVGDIRYDKVFHALATGVAGWASYEAVKRWGVVRTGAAIFVAIMMAAGAGAFVEIIEYIGSVIFENTSVGDYGNNMLDLVANTAGSVVGVVWASRVVDARPGSVSGSAPG